MNLSERHALKLRLKENQRVKFYLIPCNPEVSRFTNEGIKDVIEKSETMDTLFSHELFLTRKKMNPYNAQVIAGDFKISGAGKIITFNSELPSSIPPFRVMAIIVKPTKDQYQLFDIVTGDFKDKFKYTMFI